MIEDLINKSEKWIHDLYYSYNKMIQKIDFAKYLILYVYGGIYIDMDVKCLKSLSTLPDMHKYTGIFSSMSTNTAQRILLILINHPFGEDIVNNGIIFIARRHPIMLETMKQAYKKKDNIYKNISNFLHVFASTGPICLTNGIKHYKHAYQKGDDILILDKSYFEDCEIGKLHTCEPPPHAIGSHVYQGSWVSSGENVAVKLYYFLSENLVALVLLFMLIVILKHKS